MFVLNFLDKLDFPFKDKDPFLIEDFFMVLDFLVFEERLLPVPRTFVFASMRAPFEPLLLPRLVPLIDIFELFTRLIPVLFEPDFFVLELFLITFFPLLFVPIPFVWF